MDLDYADISRECVASGLEHFAARWNYFAAKCPEARRDLSDPLRTL
jgi:hypothetical protein